MTGSELVIALGRTSRAITVVDGPATRTLSPIEAIALVVNRADFRGFGTTRRIKRIERVRVEKPVAPWQKCWRNSGAAVVLVGVPRPCSAYMGQCA